MPQRASDLSVWCRALGGRPNVGGLPISMGVGLSQGYCMGRALATGNSDSVFNLTKLATFHFKRVSPGPPSYS